MRAVEDAELPRNVREMAPMVVAATTALSWGRVGAGERTPGRGARGKILPRDGPSTPAIDEVARLGP